MIYSKDFFDLQLRFAEKASQLSRQSLPDAIAHYTNFYRTLVDDTLFDWTSSIWQHYIDGLNHAETVTDAVVDWTYHCYQRSLEKPQPDYYRWWGCFYFTDHHGDREIVRIHFANRDESGYGALSSHQQAIRRSELAAMFGVVKDTVPEARILRGESWLYHRSEYRRLFPAVYTATPLIIPGGFQYQGLWGQFLRSDGGVLSALSSAFLQKIATQQDIHALENSFPYPILRVECDIAELYAFYDV